MSAGLQTAPVRAALWPPGQRGGEDVYAVLDGARDPRIEMLAGLLGLDHACLYADPVGPQLRSVAPFLVRLEPGRKSVDDLLDLAWGNAWGIFAIVPPGTDMRRLTLHFRRLLRVLDEAGNVLMFRFYDPRVLRAFIPTCTADQATELFGPVRRYVMEGPDDEALTLAPGDAAG